MNLCFIDVGSKFLAIRWHFKSITSQAFFFFFGATSPKLKLSCVVELYRPYIYHHYLSWKIMNFSNFFKQESCDSTSGIALICIMLDNKPLLQFWPMVFFMLIHEIWVNSMSHVCRYYKERTTRKNTLEILGAPK